MRFRYTHNAYGTKQFESEATTLIIGRPRPGQSVDIDLSPDTFVSRLHARLFYDNGSYWLEDLQSKHGSWVNGQRITGRVELIAGAHVQIGQTTFDFSGDPGPVPPHSEAPGSISVFLDAGSDPFVVPKEPAPDTALVQTQRRLRVFYTMSQALAAADDERLFPILAQQIREAIPGAQRGAVLLRDATGQLLLKTHWPPGEISVSNTWAELACSRHQAFIWTIGSDREIPPSALSARVRSAIYAPLLYNSRELGILYVDNNDISDAFSADDMELLQAIANQAALFAANAELRRDHLEQTIAQVHLNQHFAPRVAEQLFAQPDRLSAKSGHIEPVTVLAIHCHTGLSAHGLQAINETIATITPLLFNYDAIVDRRVRDSKVLGVFGSLERDNRQYERALQAAVMVRQRLSGNIFRIGIDTGSIVQGIFDTRPQVRDIYSAYETGIQLLLDRMKQQNRDLSDTLIFQQRLIDNINRTRLFGDNENLRAERTEILYYLSNLTLSIIGISFNNLCSIDATRSDIIKVFEYTVVGEAIEGALHCCNTAGDGEIVISSSLYAHAYRLVEVVPAHAKNTTNQELYVVKNLKSS